MQEEESGLVEIRKEFKIVHRPREANMDIGKYIASGRPAENPRMAPPSGSVFPLHVNQKIPGPLIGIDGDYPFSITIK